MRNVLTVAILCLAPLAAQNSARPEKRFTVTEYGAVGDGQSVNTGAIQSAIDACAKAGGGVVTIPKGTFLTGAIFLKQGVNLHVEKDGVLQGSTNPEDYPAVKTRWEGVEREWTSALVNAEGLTDFELTGEGAIDGGGEQWTQQRRQPAVGNAPRRLGRPRLVCLQNCKRVRVTRLALRNQASWCLHILYSEDVVVEDINIRAAHNIPSSDGIDVDSSRRVRINRVDIDVNDDCISIKSGKDADGLRVNRPAEDIVIENSRFGYGHGGVAMGSETSGGIRNVEVCNSIFEAENWAPIRFKSQPSRGGIVENITYRDLVLRDTRQAFEFNMEWRMVPPIAPPAKVLPLVRNVKIINVTGTVRSGGIIHGLKDSPVDGVTFEKCRITAQKGLIIENAVNVNVDGLALEVREGEPIIRR